MTCSHCDRSLARPISYAVTTDEYESGSARKEVRIVNMETGAISGKWEWEKGEYSVLAYTHPDVENMVFVHSKCVPLFDRCTQKTD